MKEKNNKMNILKEKGFSNKLKRKKKKMNVKENRL